MLSDNFFTFSLFLFELIQYYTFIFTANLAREIATSFQAEGGFPGVVGVIDATHIHIRAPEYEPGAYVNRKKFHSMNVQVRFACYKYLLASLFSI